MSKIKIPPGWCLLVRLVDFDESANVVVRAWCEIDGILQPAQAGLVAAGQEPRDADIFLPIGRSELSFVSVETDAEIDSGDDNFIQIGLAQNSIPGAPFEILLSSGRLVPEKQFSWPDSWNCPCEDISIDTAKIIGVPKLATMTTSGTYQKWSPPSGKLAKIMYSRIAFIRSANAGTRVLDFEVAEVGGDPFFVSNTFVLPTAKTYQLLASTQNYLLNEEGFSRLYYKLPEVIIDDTWEINWNQNAVFAGDSWGDNGQVAYLEFDA